MVGDRLDTDILFGKNGGIATLLVLTGELTCFEDLQNSTLRVGVSTEEDINTKGIVPDYVTRSVGDLSVLKT
jgi:4-nitrophenyl phosphatase